MKECKKCLQMKAEDGFGIDRTREDNRHPYCKDCKCSIEKVARAEGKRNYTKRKPTAMKQSEYMRRSRYNLEPERYEELLQKQKGLCAICNIFMLKPNVDHRHGKGQRFIV